MDGLALLGRLCRRVDLKNCMYIYLTNLDSAVSLLPLSKLQQSTAMYSLHICV